MRVYQVYDNADAGATDHFFRTKRDAEKYRASLDSPSEVIAHDIRLNKDGIINALNYYPIR